MKAALLLVLTFGFCPFTFDLLQKPRELHMPQWSQGLPPGSTVHVFSRSKNSTSSDTASPIPVNCSWLGCDVAGTYVPLSHVERVGVVCGEGVCCEDAPSRLCCV